MLKPGKQPRGTCPVCGRDVALKTGGVLREHSSRAERGDVCEGSGKLPAK